MKAPAAILLAVAVDLAILAGCVGVATAATAVDEDTIGRANASRACTLVLASDADMEQWWQCVTAVGDQHPTNAALLGCASTIGWHSQSDGKTAGLKIDACFRNAQMGEIIHGG